MHLKMRQYFSILYYKTLVLDYRKFTIQYYHFRTTSPFFSFFFLCFLEMGRPTLLCVSHIHVSSSQTGSKRSRSFVLKNKQNILPSVLLHPLDSFFEYVSFCILRLSCLALFEISLHQNIITSKFQFAATIVIVRTCRRFHT